MIAHIYPSVLQAVSGQGYAGCLDGCFQGHRGEAMQDLGYELPRILIPRSTVHTVGSNRPTYRREEACPRETSACSQTYDAENTTTPLKRRYGKGYIT